MHSETPAVPTRWAGERERWYANNTVFIVVRFNLPASVLHIVLINEQHGLFRARQRLGAASVHS